MLSLTNPTLEQQVEIALQTHLGGWFAQPGLGSELHKVKQMKVTPENFRTLQASLETGLAHLPVKVSAWVERVHPASRSRFDMNYQLH